MGLYTAQFRYQGPDKIDVTIKSRDQIGMMFAPPSWEIINDVKRAALTNNPDIILAAERRYIHAYNTTLDTRRSQAPDSFDSFALLCRGHNYTLCCFCGPTYFCHRHLGAYWMFTRYDIPILGERDQSYLR